MKENKMTVHQKNAEPWKITLVDTGERTLTGGRLKRISEYIQDQESFCFTYGDGLSDVNIAATIRFHQQHGKMVTVTAVKPPGRYGALNISGNQVLGFTEKPSGDGGFVNGGFFVISPACLDLIDGDNSSWEDEPLTKLSKMNQVMAYEHRGFWQPMDTLREKNLLEEMWVTGNAPWKVWK